MNKQSKLIVSGIAVAILTVGLSACDDNSKPAAPAVGQNVASVNQLQDQNENETIQGYNVAIKDPRNQYPASQMSDPLELQMLKERDLYLNDSSKIMYIYIFPTGRNEVFYSSVRGKVASMSSEMTATNGVYLNNSCDGCTSSMDSLSVPMPQDDLSYGGTEFGDNGIFWFDEQGGFHEAGVAGATVMIESSPLSLNAIKLPAQPMDPKILAKLNTK